MKNLFFLIFGLSLLKNAEAQKTKPVSADSILNADINYDELFNELDDFLDSLLKPRSYSIINISAGLNFLDYSTATENLKSRRQLIITPSFSHYGKSGFGLSASANIVREKNKLNPYQYIGTISYDYLKNLDYVGGISASHYFTKDSVAFYTSPLKNELFAFFSYRSLWFKPSVSASYGWGSKQSMEEREDYITALRLRRGSTQVTTKESINDFNLMLAVRHDFYWLNVFTAKDFIRLTPQINFTSGTQSFGLNQTSNTYRSHLVSGKNDLYRSENETLDSSVEFQPLSVAAALKSELSIGKFFIQPQLVLNYYIPAEEKNLATMFMLNTGFFF